MKSLLSLLVAFALFTCVATLPHEDEWLETPKQQALVADRIEELQVPSLIEVNDYLAETESNTGLAAQLDAVNPIVDLKTDDAQFLLTFTVYNPSKEAKKMLKWATPFQTNKRNHVDGNIFVIHDAEGKLIKYTGRDAKKKVSKSGAAPADQYLSIQGGRSITNRVNPAASYAFSSDGYYYIRVRQPNVFHNTYLDVMRTSTKVYLKNVAALVARKNAAATKRMVLAQTMDHPCKPKPGKEPWHAHCDVANTEEQCTGKGRAGAIYCNWVKAAPQQVVKYIGCSTARKAKLVRFHADAKDKIREAAACTALNSCAAKVDSWFGKKTTQAKFADRVVTQYKKMLTLMDGSTYVCGGKEISRNCDSGTMAYVYPDDAQQKIYMCPYVMDMDEDYAEQVQTVVHELSHFETVGDTNDNVYGEAGGKRLARRKPDKAYATADNIGYFAKFQPGPFCHAPNDYNPDCEDEWSNCNQKWMCDEEQGGDPKGCCVSCGGGGSKGCRAGCPGCATTLASLAATATPPRTPAVLASSVEKAEDNCGSWAVMHDCSKTYQIRRNTVKLEDHCPLACKATAATDATLIDQSAQCSAWVKVHDCNLAHSINGKAMKLKTFCSKSCGTVG